MYIADLEKISTDSILLSSTCNQIFFSYFEINISKTYFNLRSQADHVSEQKCLAIPICEYRNRWFPLKTQHCSAPNPHLISSNVLWKDIACEFNNSYNQILASVQYITSKIHMQLSKCPPFAWFVEKHTGIVLSNRWRLYLFYQLMQSIH